MATKGKQRKKGGLSGIERTEQAYKILKNRIFSGFYLPRQHLVESSLSEDLGVNRMTVREMLKRLTLEGLVVTNPIRAVLWLVSLSNRPMKRTRWKLSWRVLRPSLLPIVWAAMSLKNLNTLLMSLKGWIPGR